MPDDRKLPFSRRATEPSVTAYGAARRDPRATIQPTGEEHFPEEPATSSETPDAKQRSSRRGEPTMLDLMQAIEGIKSSFNRELGDVKRELRMHAEEIEVLRKAPRSLSPVPALGAVGRTSPPVASPGNPSDVLVPVRSKLPSMTGDPQIDGARLKALEADAADDSLRYRSLADTVHDMQVSFKQLESAVKAQPVAAEKAAEKVATVAVATTAEQTSSIERMLTNKTFTNLVYMVAALFVGLFAQTLANRALTKGDTEKTAEVVAEKAAKEVARDTKPTVVIVREHDTEKDAAP